MNETCQIRSNIQLGQRRTLHGSGESSHSISQRPFELVSAILNPLNFYFVCLSVVIFTAVTTAKLAQRRMTGWLVNNEPEMMPKERVAS